jgi:hypothetical protein
MRNRILVPAGQRFVSIAFHDVVDRPDELEFDAVTATLLVQFFDWLTMSVSQQVIEGRELGQYFVAGRCPSHLYRCYTKLLVESIHIL